MLKKRIATALVLVPVLLIAIFYLPMLWFSIVIGAIIIWAAWEWSALIGWKEKYFRLGYVAIVLLLLIMSYFMLNAANFALINWILGITFLVWIWASVGMLNYAFGRSPLGLHYPILKALMGLFALVPCWIAVVMIREIIGSPAWLLFGLLIIWGGMDTGAYLAGRLWGRHKLAPRVSPKKTWEGFFGGIILTVIITIIMSAAVFHVSLPQVFTFCIVAIIVGIFAVMGDLVESMLKRQVGIKDSGSGLPGHGGILDRIDSVTAALPVFALALLILLGL